MIKTRAKLEQSRSIQYCRLSQRHRGGNHTAVELTQLKSVTSAFSACKNWGQPAGVTDTCEFAFAYIRMRTSCLESRADFFVRHRDGSPNSHILLTGTPADCHQLMHGRSLKYLTSTNSRRFLEGGGGKQQWVPGVPVCRRGASGGFVSAGSRLRR